MQKAFMDGAEDAYHPSVWAVLVRNMLTPEDVAGALALMTLSGPELRKLGLQAVKACL
jgi:hypothetical protein